MSDSRNQNGQGTTEYADRKIGREEKGCLCTEGLAPQEMDHLEVRTENSRVIPMKIPDSRCKGTRFVMRT